VATNTYSKWGKLKATLKRWEFWVGILAVVVTFGLAIVIVWRWELVQALAGYGYLGGFIISVFGGATIIIPVPVQAVQFALGGVLKPWVGPDFLGPLFVGVACSLGETLGSLTIYLTGYSSGTPFVHAQAGRIQRAYLRLMRLMERRGSITLFLLSAIFNPFLYPASLAAGALRFGIKRYFLICFAGKTIKCIAIAYCGYFGLGALLRWLGVSI